MPAKGLDALARRYESDEEFRERLDRACELSDAMRLAEEYGFDVTEEEARGDAHAEGAPAGTHGTWFGQC